MASEGNYRKISFLGMVLNTTLWEYILIAIKTPIPTTTTPTTTPTIIPR